MFARGFVSEDDLSCIDIRKRTTSARTACSLARLSLAVIRNKANAFKRRPRTESMAWLYDNEDMISQTVGEALREAGKLGKMRSVKVSGVKYPISFMLAYRYASEHENLVKKEELSRYLKNAACEYELKNSELGCFDIMLKLALAVRLAGENEENAALFKNGVTSLSKLSSMDFSDVFFEASPVESALSRDPSYVYPRMDKKTRLYYHSRIEKLARLEKISETEAARIVVHAAKIETDERKRHVGFLLTEGISELNKERRDAASAHIFYITALTAIGAFFTALFTGSALGTVFASVFILDIVKKLAARIGLSQSPPAEVLRMDFSDGIPDSHRTLAVISLLIDSCASIDRFGVLLEEYYLSNRDDNISFGILGDLKDSETQYCEKDEKLVAYACNVIERLNEKYESEPFCLFVRSRIYNEKDKKYMSYERKRGALLELSRLIDKKERGTFSKIICKRDISSFEHVVTFDFDTRPTPHSLIRLIEAAAHPMNAPQISADNARVSAGYGILQPRIVPNLCGEDASLFLRMISGAGGVSSYSDLRGDKYQDLFGDGTYIGKGLFSPRVFSRVLFCAIADNAVLSHDLLEGAYVRVGFVSDVEWSDEEPKDFKSFFVRQARWTRGDFQLLPWLFFRVRNKEGKKVKNPIGVLGRVKIAETMLRSLMPAGMMFTTAATVAAAPSFGYIPFAMMIINLFLPVLGSMIARIRAKQITRPFSRHLSGIQRSALRALTSFAILPFEAVQNISCALISVWRLMVTKKNMLEWSSTQFASSKGDTLGAYIRYMFVCPLSSAALLFFPHTILSLTVAIIFAAAPAAAYAMSRDVRPKDALSSGQKDELRAQAKAMWGYFKDLITPFDNYLIPDNFQVEPYIGAAHRTSPTNIGLSLVSMLAAYDFAFIDKTELFSYVENTIKTVLKLKKYHGHLYNWYDTRSLSVLSPNYVSTVDSGNFAACLITLKEGLKDLGAPNELIISIGKLIKEADFSVLYSKERRLFHVGCNISEGKADEAYYDLLASEARQTSFIACALGHVPPEHWKALSRDCAKVGRFGGLYSWTGTMFEYFMPALFMPPYYNSLIYESLRFSVFCQRARVGRNNIFGISESAYCAFDGSLAYQYKAFGIPDIAKRRDADGSLVISPYSSYLALLTDKRAAFDNLRLMANISPSGRYGFYEALDFENRASGEHYAPVKTYMAHHLGMSLVSCANAVFGNIMQRRFMSDKRMSAFSPFLKERAELNIKAEKRKYPYLKKTGVSKAESARFELEAEDIDAFAPRAHVLGSLRFSSVITDAGAGFTRSEGVLVSRRGFHAEDPKGIFFFAGEKDTKSAMGLTFSPAYDKSVFYSVRFLTHSAEFSAEGHGFITKLDVLSGAGKPLEIRTATVKNALKRTRNVCLSMYFEPVIASFSQDEEHRTFSNLFIETSYNESDRLLIVKRRSRGEKNAESYLVAAFFGDTDELLITTDRRDVRERLSNAAELLHEALRVNKQTFGGVIDPCVFSRAEKTLKNDESLTLGAVIASGKDLSELLTLARSHRNKGEQEALCNEALARAAAENDIGRLGAEIRRRALDILPCLYLNMPQRDALSKYIVNNVQPKCALWKYCVSGDLPILIYVLKGEEDGDGLREAFKMLLLFYMRGVEADLIVPYKEQGGYLRPLETFIRETAHDCALFSLLDAHGGVHIINTLAIPHEDETLIMSCAAYVFGEDKISRSSRSAPKAHIERCAPGWDLSQLKLQNGIGGFSENGYVVASVPAAPYSHILSNGRAGALLTSAGGGYSFIDNARENKLTPMTFDAICEPPTETTRLIFSGEERLLERPEGRGKRHVKYTAGAAEYSFSGQGVRARETVFIPFETDAVCRIIDIYNDTDKPISIRTAFTAPLLLGAVENDSFRHIVTSYDEKTKAVTAKNAANSDFPESRAYIYCDTLSAFTCEYEDVLKGRYDTKKTGYTRRACFSVCCDKELAPNESASFVIMLGAFSKESDLLKAIERADVRNMRSELLNVKKTFGSLFGKIKISSPDEKLDMLFNGPLLYQTYICRIMARTSFYQCGGAWGFRDQLQDCLSVMYIDPDLVREHIIYACAHQFVEGDVQHWWHPIQPKEENESHRGVRSRYSDDRLWLVYTVMRYAEFTKDHDIFSQYAPFITQPPLDKSESESYATPKMSGESASVFEHCVRAVEASLSFGAHGLCRIGGGDWNDGFNKVGEEGKGESVWLSWFLSGILSDFSDVCERMGRCELSIKYRDISHRLSESIEREAWDSDRYIRAFYDDGEPLGARGCSECQIDSLSQSFSVISQPESIGKRKLTALSTAVRELCDREHGIVRLFWPPFDDSPKNPGYVKGYAPGVRENGGQYTHASVWLCRALFWAGENDTAYELLSMQNPLNHTDTKEKALHYGAEPYVIAADVCSAGENAGRGGWSWYTGAASWYYIVTIEDLFGIRIKGGTLSFLPHLPSKWDAAKLTLEYREAKYSIEYRNIQKKNAAVRVTFDGEIMSGNEIPLSGDKKFHKVLVEV